MRMAVEKYCNTLPLKLLLGSCEHSKYVWGRATVAILSARVCCCQACEGFFTHQPPATKSQEEVYQSPGGGPRSPPLGSLQLQTGENIKTGSTNFFLVFTCSEASGTLYREPCQEKATNCFWIYELRKTVRRTQNDTNMCQNHFKIDKFH